MSAQNMTLLSTMPTPPNRRTDTPEVFSEKAQATVDAEKRMVDEFNTSIIPAHNATVEPMNRVLANITDINTVAGINPAVSTVASIKDNVLSVDGVKAQVVRVSQSANNVDRVHQSISAVDTVNAHIANVDTVSAHVDNIDTVAGIAPAVADLSADHAMLTRLDVQTPMLTRVDAVRADVSTVAGIETAVTAVAADRAAVTTVYTAMPTIEAVETNLPHIIAVDAAETAIKTLGLHINNIDAVGANIADVNAVYGALGEIATVKADLPHIRTAAAHADNIDAVGRNIAAVQEVDRRMQLILDAPDNAAVAATSALESQKQAGLAKQYAESASAVAGLPVATDQNDQQPVIYSKDLGKFTFGTPGGSAILPAPAITLPAQLTIGFPVNFILTGLPALVGSSVTGFQVQVNDGEINDVTATDNAYTGTITAQGAEGAVWTLKARAKDDKGNTSLWNQTTATLVTPFVNTPNVTSPLANAIVGNKTVALTCSPFATTHLADTHKASRWTISTDAAGNNILHDSGWRQDALTEYTAVIDPVAAANSAMFAHVQHEGVKIGQSAKSPAVPLTTSYVLRPAVTSPLMSTMVGTDRIEMTCSAFATYAGNFDTHVATRWWVTTDAAGNNALADSGWQSSYLTEYTATLSPLADPASDLYLWVAQRGELLGDSAKSTSVRVVTGSLQTPTITSPAVGTVVLPTGLTVKGSPFTPVSGATDTMKALYVQAATDALFTNKIYDSGRIITESTTHTMTFAAQAQGAAVFVRIRYEGVTLGISGYSEALRVVVTQAQTPTITSPTANATGVPVKPQIVMTPYEATGSLDSGENTRVQVATDNTFANIVYDSGELAYTTTHAVVTALPPAAGACVRVQHKGALLGWTPWSESVSFTTGAVQTPVITAPNASSGLLQPTFTVTGSPFSAIGATDTLKAVRIQVAKDISFTNLVYNQRTVTASTTNTITITAQAGSPTLHLRMLYEGNALGESEFSDAVQIVVSPVLAPTITSPVEGGTCINSVTVVTNPLLCTGGLTDSLASADFKLTTDETGANIVAQATVATLSHTFQNFNFTPGTHFVHVKHKGVNFGYGPWSTARRIAFEVGVITPGGRKLYRHASNKGTVMEFNDGQARKVLVLDAQYRDKKKWGTYGYDMPNLTNYQSGNTRGDWHLNTSNEPNTNAATVMTDAQINSLWSGSIDNKTAKQNCDEWMTRNGATDSDDIVGVPAVVHARSVMVDGKACDVPNIQTLMRIFLEADELDKLDPTVAANKTKALGSQNSAGFWNCMGANRAWASTEYSSRNVRYVYNNGGCNATSKYLEFFVVPVQEL